MGKYIIIICIVVISCACNREYSKVVKSSDVEYKLEMADKYYEKGDCDKCIPLYEEILIYFKGKKNVEQAYYRYAECHYKLGEYQLAAFYFKNFVSSYPKSALAEQAAFMAAKCYVEESPKYSLDQVSTYEAIDKMQEFANKYPESAKVEEANNTIDEMRAKLMKKDYESAYLYFRVRNYNAAAVSFQNLVEDYPDFYDLEKAYYYIVKSYKLYADNSYADKKLERYKLSLKAYNEFVKKFPQSTYLKELNDIKGSIDNNLKNIDDEQKDDRKKERRG